MPKKTKLKNSNKMDMINGPIWNKLPRFALPVAATAILEQLFNASDIAVVGNFTGAAKTASVAAVGANSPVIGLILNLFIGIALGTNVIIANAIGRDDRETVQRAVHTSVLTAIIGGFLVMIPGEIFAVQILSVMSIPEDVLPYAVLYLRIYLLGLPVILLYNFLSAVFRSVGDTKTPLIVLALSGCLNVLLNLFFVIVLKMTVNGVAIATVISNAISSIVLFIVLMKSDKYIKLSLRELRIDKRVLGQILEIGLPAGIQSAVFAISNIIIQAAINSLGTIVIAASSAAFNIEVIAYDVFNSFSQACTTFVGQNYGAGKLDRCKKTLLLSIAEDTIATAVTIGLVLFSGRFLLSIFTSDPQVIELGYTSSVICPVVLHAVFQQLHRPPPGVIHLSVAHLINGGVALVTGGEIVQHKGEVVHIGFHFAGLFQPVRVLVQSPRQHGSGIRHRQIELDMVAGIVPAAGDFVGHGGIGTPLHFVPFRKRSCLLTFIKVHGLLESLGVIGGKAHRRNRHRRQSTDTQTDCGQQSRGTCASSHLHHLPFC